MSQDRFLEFQAARLRWRIEGSGPALALLHGWALDLSIWDPLAGHLAGGFTLLRMDRRGFGLSTGQPDIHRNVDDLAAVLDAAGLQRVALLGMSQGARLALHFALRHRARVRALVLDGAPEVESESELPLEVYRQLLEGQGEEALKRAILAHPLMQTRGPPEAQSVLEGAVASYRGQDLRHAVPRAPAPSLSRISVPTLVLNGNLDSPARMAAGEALQRSIVGAQRVLLSGAGHLAVLDDPQAYADAVGGFLRGLPG